MNDDGAIPTNEQLGSISDGAEHLAAQPEAVENTSIPSPPQDDAPPDTTPNANDLSVDDLTAAFERAMEVAEAKRMAKAAEAAELADLTDDEIKIRNQAAEIERLRAEKLAAEQSAAQEKLLHEIRSAAGKFKMTDAEVLAVGTFFEKNPEYFGVWSFERAALRVFPEIEGRLRSAPASQPRNGAPAGGGNEASGVVSTSTGGPSTPAPFKHNGRRFDYSDVTASALAEGWASKLGEYR